MAEPETENTGTYQSLYRRFRPQRFDEVLGQEHVSLALRNSVRSHRVGHAYLFSGPRGTGKTSTARILAKALNCAKEQDGEPCGVCDSCVEIARGTSLDVHELDAASNNGVEAMRDLVARAALGTPGRWKVYIVDEVHMLTAAASNALLKTLEEPPGHVVFVLATTDPQKVLPTIRSRTQHFEFRLLPPHTLEALLREVSAAAGLSLGDDAVASAVRRGRGSARDALSALDQVAAAGVVEDEFPVVAELTEALAERDAPRALVAVGHAMHAGRDVQGVTGLLVESLRQAFLLTIAPELASVAGTDRQHLEEAARRMGLPAVVRAMETLGKSQVDMKDAPDPRVNLETALIRLSHPEADDAPSAILERLDRLERGLGGSPPALAARPAPTADEAGAGVPEPKGDATGEGPGLARKSLGALAAPTAPAPAPSSQSQSPPPPAPGAGSGTAPSRDELVQAWGDTLLASLSNRARARFRVGRFTAMEEGTAVFALPNETHRSYCEDVRVEVEHLLSQHFGVPVKMRLVVDEEAEGAASPVPPRPAARGRSAKASSSVGPAPEVDAEDAALLDPELLAAETEPAGSGLTPEQRLIQAFPGAEEM